MKAPPAFAGSVACATMPNIKRDQRWLNSIGSRVHVEGKGGGVLQYYGRVRKTDAVSDHGKTMCGVELDEPVGTTDGTFGMWRYFTCEPKFGCFAAIDKVQFEAEYYAPHAVAKRARTARTRGDKNNVSASQEMIKMRKLRDENKRLKARLAAQAAAAKASPSKYDEDDIDAIIHTPQHHALPGAVPDVHCNPVEKGEFRSSVETQA